MIAKIKKLIGYGVLVSVVCIAALLPQTASADVPLYTPQPTKAVTSSPKVTAKPTAKPTATPTAKPTEATTPVPRTFEITSFQWADKGDITVYWEDSKGAGPYKVWYECADKDNVRQCSYWAGYDEEASTTYSKSFTLSYLIPGKQYIIGVMDNNGVETDQKLSVPSAETFTDGRLKASSLKITTDYRYQISGSSKVYTASSFVASDMIRNISQNGYKYGVYYRIDIPQLAYSRDYKYKIAFVAPNGFVFCYAGSARFDDFGNASGSYWSWDCLGSSFFGLLYDKNNTIPTGTYSIELYLDGQYVNTSTFKVI